MVHEKRTTVGRPGECRPALAVARGHDDPLVRAVDPNHDETCFLCPWVAPNECDPGPIRREDRSRVDLRAADDGRRRSGDRVADEDVPGMGIGDQAVAGGHDCCREPPWLVADHDNTGGEREGQEGDQDDHSSGAPREARRRGDHGHEAEQDRPPERQSICRRSRDRISVDAPRRTCIGLEASCQPALERAQLIHRRAPFPVGGGGAPIAPACRKGFAPSHMRARWHRSPPGTAWPRGPGHWRRAEPGRSVGQWR